MLRLDQAGRPYNEGEQVVIGGNERYVSVCRKHYKKRSVEVGSLTAIQKGIATINKNFFTDRGEQGAFILSVCLRTSSGPYTPFSAVFLTPLYASQSAYTPTLTCNL